MVYTISYIGLGSNQQDPVAQVLQARTALDKLPHTRLMRCSSLYTSAPVGEIQDQPDFINAVCEIETGLPAGELLAELLAIERAAGRVRDGSHGGPRILDLDLLIFGKEVINKPDLVVPHPRLHERAFVLYPLAEIDANIMVPGQGLAGELVQRLHGQRIVRAD